MTVTVRPVPQRVARNGIRPFRPVVPTNNLGPVTIRNWRPPVPEPLPPAPLIGPRGLLALGALVLAQIWGQLGSRPQREAQVPEQVQVPRSGTVAPDGNATPSTFRWRKSGGTMTAYGNAQCVVYTYGVGASDWVSYSNILSATLEVVEQGTCGPRSMAWRITFADGSTGLSDLVWGDYYGLISTPQIETEWLGPSPVPYLPPTVPIPLPDPYPVPEPEIQPETEPQKQPPRVPLPIRPAAPPTTKPGGPSPLPGAPPVIVPATPGPAAPPVPAPGRSPSPAPANVPGASPLPNGVVPPAPTAVVPTTPPDAHFPVPGAPPVTGNGPRPTPEGIAQELGRLEQKVARLSNPQTDATGDATDRIGLALKLLGDLIEFFNSITAGGGYALSSPCEVDEAGQPIPVVVNFSGAPTALGVINNKIDAVAQLLQEHKNLKQPICRQTPAVGEPVTVQFVQVD